MSRRDPGCRRHRFRDLRTLAESMSSLSRGIVTGEARESFGDWALDMGEVLLAGVPGLPEKSLSASALHPSIPNSLPLWGAGLTGARRLGRATGAIMPAFRRMPSLCAKFSRGAGSRRRKRDRRPEGPRRARRGSVLAQEPGPAPLGSSNPGEPKQSAAAPTNKKKTETAKTVKMMHL